MTQPPLQTIVFGEALIDLKASSGLQFTGFVGGSPLNVAVAASRLGVATALAGRVSTDFFGDAIINHLQHNAVSLDWVERGSEPSTLAFVSANTEAVRYAFRAEGAADRHYQPPASLPSSLSVVHYGAFNVMFDPAGQRVLELVRRSTQALHHFDPNIRPSLVDNREQYMSRFAEFLAQADWLKLSSEDLAWLAPEHTELDTVSNWLASGPSVVVVTDGAVGARLYRLGREVIAVPAPEIAFVDAIGAGDTFSGATISALVAHGLLNRAALLSASDDVLRRIVQFAAHAAAINCSRAGCNPPTHEEVMVSL
jgi:fructokinase